MNGLKGAGFAALILVICLILISAVANATAVSDGDISKSKKINIRKIQEKYKVLENPQKRTSTEELLLASNGTRGETEVVKRISSDQM